MKKIISLLLLILTTISYGQDHLDYSSQLRNYTGTNTIDGAEINPLQRFANISTDYMVITDKSAIMFVNCIVKVDGLVDASANCKIRLINSYIICKKYKGPASSQIIVTDNIASCKISDVKFMKKIKGNPFIEVINKSGKVVIKGYKESLKDKRVKTGIYDIRSPGNFYEKNILLANN